MLRLKYNSNNFFHLLQKSLNKRDFSDNSSIQNSVKKIINEINIKGDVALINFTKKFDKIVLNKNNIRLDLNSINYKSKIDINVLNSFKKAIKNITKFHKKQIPNDIFHKDNNVTLRSRWTPIDSVGLYIPGGNAFYPSSLIMNVIPAKIAGVKRIVCVTPPTENINPYFLIKSRMVN